MVKMFPLFFFPRAETRALGNGQELEAETWMDLSVAQADLQTKCKRPGQCETGVVRLW